MKPGLKITRDDLGNVLAGVRSLTERQVLVGVPAAKAPREAEELKGQPINNAALAYIHEFGAPAANIPARPFLVPGVESVEDEIAARYKRAAEVAISDNTDRAAVIDRAHHAVGLTAQAAVRRKITDGPFTPLAPSTLAARRARGVKRTKPLIDTGQLRAAQTYVIRGPGERPEE